MAVAVSACVTAPGHLQGSRPTITTARFRRASSLIAGARYALGSGQDLQSTTFTMTSETPRTPAERRFLRPSVSRVSGQSMQSMS